MSNSLSGLDIGLLQNTASTKTKTKSTNTSAGSTSLDMTDFLSLIVKQFQNQDIENAASTTDMMNQLVQMSVMQAVTNITEATTMMYTAGLVGKEVTVGKYNEKGTLEEIVGTVTATGTYGGQPVVFVDGVSYSLSAIMAVGKLPKPDSAEQLKNGSSKVSSNV